MDTLDDIILDEISEQTLNQELDALESGLKLDVFIIDAGWDSVAHQVLHREMPLIKTYLTTHNLYVLTPEQSIRLLTSHPQMIGKDPILMVVDKFARALANPHGYGARIHLGTISEEHHVLWLIRMFLQIVNNHSETLDIAYTFQQYNYKEGIKGTVEIVMESFGNRVQGGH